MAEETEESGARQGTPEVVPPAETDTPAAVEAGQANLELILDVPLGITVELGRVPMSVRHLLALTPGSVVELTKLAGEPLDVLINGKAVARGEAVMVGDKFGVRLTEIMTPTERVEQLR